MQVRRFHTGRQDIHKAPILVDGKVRLHSVVDGKAIFEVGKADEHHVIYLFINADDLWAMNSVRDIMKSGQQAA